MINNCMVRDIYNKLKADDDDRFVENVAEWIRDKFKYPLDVNGDPAAQAQLLKFKSGWFSYIFKKCVEYHWSLPTEVITSGYGICIDTSNLAESVLRVKPLKESYVVLGEVRRTLDDVLLGYHAWCIPSGTMINCGGFQKSIEKVKIGDYVLTKSGKLERVIDIPRRVYSGFVVEVNRHFRNEPLVLTEDHPVLTNRGWILARDLKESDMVCEPILTEVYNMQFFERKIVHEHLPVWHVNKEIKIRIPIKADILRLIGYYLAEGVISGIVRKKHRRYVPTPRVIWYFSKKEKDLVNDVKRIVEENFNINVRVYPYERDLVRVECVSRALYELLSEFGKGVQHKFIPYWAMTLPPKKQLHIVKGYLLGDGHIGKYEVEFSSASLELIEDIKMILLRLGIMSSLRKIQAEYRKRSNRYYGNPSDHYILSVSGIDRARLMRLLGFEHRKGKKNINRFICGNLAFYPIRYIRKRWVEKLPVYNLTVENSQTYTANDILVHNCELPYKGKRYVLETTIHEKDVKNLVLADDIYGRKLDVYYVKHAEYDENEYRPVTSLGAYQIIYLLGLPGRSVEKYGLMWASKLKAKKLYKLWREEEKLKLEMIVNALKKR